MQYDKPLFPIVLAILGLVCHGTIQRASLFAAPPESGIQLELSGPPGQWISLSIGYFSGDDQLARWTIKKERLQLVDGVTSINLEQDYDGYAVDVFSPTKQPIKIQLRREDDILDVQQSDAVGHTMVGTGEVTALENVSATDLSLREGEKKLLIRWLAAFDDGDAESIVSDAEVANIDWPSLNAFADLVGEVLGSRVDDPLDGWATWKGEQDTIVFAGKLSYKKGDAQAVLVTLDDKLVDLVFTSERLPDVWHTGEAAIQEYAARGSTLIRHMFAGQVEKAHEIFSHRTHQQITIDNLRPVHQSLVDQFGDSVESIQLRDHQLTKAKSEDDRKLILYFDLVTDRGKQCDGTVDVFLDHFSGLVPRGHLASFNVKEKGPSIPADAKELVTSVLTGLSRSEIAPFQQQLSEPMLEFFSEDKLKDEIDRWQNHLGAIEKPIVWADWKDAAGNKGVEGPVQFAKGKANVRVDFGDDNVIGVTVMGTKYAGSTLDCLQNTEAISEHASLFWRRLFSGEFDAGYEMLPDAFQKQLSRDQFLEMTKKLANVQAKVSDVTIRSVRIDTKPDRVAPVMVETICMLKFDNDQYQTAKCEYHVSGANQFDLYTFNTEFSAEFPVRFQDHTSFLTAVASEQAGNLIDLFHPSHHDQIDRQVLEALMLEIRHRWGDLKEANIDGIAIRKYDGASEEVTKVTADLAFAKATVPTEWTYVYGHLKSFHFQSKDVEGFPKNIKDIPAYRSRGEQLFEHWFEGEIADAVEMLAPELRNEKTATEMERLKKDVNDALGKFESVTHQSESFDDQGKRLTQQWKLAFTGGEAKGKVIFAFDALQAFIMQADLATVDPEDAKKTPAKEVPQENE